MGSRAERSGYERWRESQDDPHRDSFAIRGESIQSYLTETIWQAPRREDGKVGELVARVRDSVLEGDPRGARALIDPWLRANTAKEFTSLLWQYSTRGFPLLWEMDVRCTDRATLQNCGVQSTVEGPIPTLLFLQSTVPTLVDDSLLSDLHEFLTDLGLQVEQEHLWNSVYQVSTLLMRGMDCVDEGLRGDTEQIYSTERFRDTFGISGLWDELPDSSPVAIDSRGYWTLLQRVFGLWWDVIGNSMRYYLLTVLAAQVWKYTLMEGESREELLYRTVDLLLPDYCQNTVAQWVGEEKMERVRTMAETMRQCVRQGVLEGELYSPHSREGALEKIDRLEIIIGLPARVYRLEGEVRGSTFWQIWWEIYGEYWKALSLLLQRGAPPAFVGLERATFGHTVNAFYLPQQNLVLIPPGIIGAPFCCREDPWALYGSLGVILGHEILHSLDLNGSMYDADGQYRLWWDRETKERYYRQVSQMVKHYASLEIDGYPLRWDQTTGEDFSDIAGLQLALASCQAENGEGTVEDWREFYRSWSNSMRSALAGIRLSHVIDYDPHSPSRIRAWAPFYHTDLYYRAYDISPTDPLYLSPENRSHFLPFCRG